MALTASGRNSGSSRIRAAKATNSPLPVIPTMKPGPAPCAPDSTRMAMLRTIGTTASTASPARLRRRPKMIPSSECRKRTGCARTGAGAGTGSRVVAMTSAADIEPLTGQGHEDVLQTRPLDGEAEHRDAVLDQVQHDLLHRHLTEVGRHVTRPDADVGEAQLAQHLCGVLGAAGIGVHPHRVHRGGAQFGHGALGDELSL